MRKLYKMLPLSALLLAFFLPEVSLAVPYPAQSGLSCPTGVDFGTQADCGELTVTANNGPITFGPVGTRVTFTPLSHPEHFIIEPATVNPCGAEDGFTLQEGENCNLAHVTYAPAVPTSGYDPLDVTITPTAGSDSTKRYYASARAGRVALSGVSCGNGAPFTEVQDCGTLTLTASSGPLELPDLASLYSVSGTDAALFVFSTPADNPCQAGYLPTGASCNIADVAYDPDVPSYGYDTASLMVNVLIGQDKTISLSASSYAGGISFSLSGNEGCGSSGVPYTSTQNCGTLILTVTSAAVILPDPASLYTVSGENASQFTISAPSANPCTAGTMMPGESCAVAQVTFTPSHPTSGSWDSAKIEVNLAHGSDRSTTVSANAYAGEVSFGSVSCPRIPINTTVVCGDLPITIVRDAPVVLKGDVLSSIVAAYQDPDMFQLAPPESNPCPVGTEILPGTTCNVASVIYAPTALPTSGEYQTVQFTLWPKWGKRDWVYVSGRVYAGKLIVGLNCPTFSSPGTRVICSPLTITAENGPVFIGSGPRYTVGGEDSDDFTFAPPSSNACPEGEFWLQEGESCTIADVSVVPDEEGPVSIDVSVDPEIGTGGSETIEGETAPYTYAWVTTPTGVCLDGTGSWVYGPWSPTVGCGETTQTRTKNCAFNANSGKQEVTATCERSDGMAMTDESHCDSAGPKPEFGDPCTPTDPAVCGTPVDSQTVTLNNACGTSGAIQAACADVPEDDYCVVVGL